MTTKQRAEDRIAETAPSNAIPIKASSAEPEYITVGDIRIEPVIRRTGEVITNEMVRKARREIGC